MKSLRDRSKAPWRLLIVGCLTLRALVAGAEPADEVRAAELLVRKTYYEGMPFEAARARSHAKARSSLRARCPIANGMASRSR